MVDTVLAHVAGAITPTALTRNRCSTSLICVRRLCIALVLFGFSARSAHASAQHTLCAAHHAPPAAESDAAVAHRSWSVNCGTWAPTRCTEILTDTARSVLSCAGVGQHWVAFAEAGAAELVPVPLPILEAAHVRLPTGDGVRLRVGCDSNFGPLTEVIWYAQPDYRVVQALRERSVVYACAADLARVPLADLPALVMTATLPRDLGADVEVRATRTTSGRWPGDSSWCAGDGPSVDEATFRARQRDDASDVCAFHWDVGARQLRLGSSAPAVCTDVVVEDLLGEHAELSALPASEAAFAAPDEWPRSLPDDPCAHMRRDDVDAHAAGMTAALEGVRSLIEASALFDARDVAYASLRRWCADPRPMRATIEEVDTAIRAADEARARTEAARARHCDLTTAIHTASEEGSAASLRTVPPMRRQLQRVDRDLRAAGVDPEGVECTDSGE